MRFNLKGQNANIRFMALVMNCGERGIWIQKKELLFLHQFLIGHIA